jgi:alkylation response protein AidB-like acyl-CoA dehydrogenase
VNEDIEMLTGVAGDVFAGVEGADEASTGLERLWPTVVELGWSTIGVPEELGGAGGTTADLGAIVRAVGRHTVAVPLLEAATAAWVLAVAGEDLPDAGFATLAQPGGTVAIDDEGRLAGDPITVPWAEAATHAVIVAVRGGQELVALVATDQGSSTPATNLAGEPRPEMALDGVVARVLADAPRPAAIRERAALLSTAALVGAMETALRLTREHVRTREQFGRPLARFQVVSSALAAMASDVGLAASALDAALEQHTDPATGTLAVAAARVTALEVATEVAAQAHHLHGAMGITREYPLHRATRRIWAWRDEWGSARSWRRDLGTATLEAGPAAFWDQVTDLSGAGAPLSGGGS